MEREECGLGEEARADRDHALIDIEGPSESWGGPLMSGSAVSSSGVDCRAISSDATKSGGHVHQQLPKEQESVQDYGPDPSKDPLAYPGRWMTNDALMVGDALLPMRLVKGRRLPQARVGIGVRESQGMRRAAPGHIPLRQALLDLNVARMEDRIPHIAVGSNANPVRLLGKLRSQHVSDVAPITIARVSGIGIRFLTRISGYKAYPTTPCLEAPSSTPDLELVIAWLTVHQSCAIASTEVGYDSVCTDLTGSISAELANGEKLEEAVMYWGKGPTWEDRAGKGLSLRMSPKDGSIVELTQERIQILISRGEAQEGQPAQRPFTDVMDWSLTRPYGAQGGCDDSGWADLTDTDGQLQADSYRVLPSAALENREGDSWVSMHPEDATSASIASKWVLVTREGLPGPDGLPETPSGLIARVKTDLGVPRGSIQVDQQIRDGLGVEIREVVHVAPVSHNRNWLGELLAPSPIYVVCRIQFAELVGAERNVALVDEIALKIAGAESGDEVVIEGLTAPSSSRRPAGVRTLRCRAIPVDASFQDARRALAGGDSESRFPDASTALGVYPDLPWIYLDQDARQVLGINNNKLAAVRVRSSRRHLLAREIREIVLLLAVTVLGLMTITDNVILRVALLAVVACGATFVVVHRLRRRISPAP